MKIACISASMIPGNTANAIQTMKACEALEQLGHQVELYLPNFGDEFSWDQASRQYGVSQPFPVHRLSVWMPFGRYDFSLRAVLQARKWGANLFYVWPLQAAALCSRLGVPTLLEAHDKPQGRFGPRLFRNFLMGKGAKGLLVTTHALGRYLISEYGEDQVGDLVIYSPNGVDLERYQRLPNPSKARQRLQLDDAFTAVYSGHLYEGRGAELMYELARREPKISFVWAGGTAEAVDRWEKRRRSDGLKNLTLLGFIPNEELPIVQAAADVLLMPYGRRIGISGGGDSARFASPMKLFEYMASGRAIMSSDLPVIREILNEQLAQLLPPEDINEWQAALLKLRTDRSYRQRLARAARTEAGKYAWQKRAERALTGFNG